MAGDTESLLEFPIFVLSYIEEECLDNVPVLGIKREMSARFKNDEQAAAEFKKYNVFNGQDYLYEILLEDLVEVVKDNKQLIQEFCGYCFNAEEFVSEIEKETGFKIPMVFAKFAEMKFNERKKILLDKFRAYNLENGGDTNEDCVVL